MSTMGRVCLEKQQQLNNWCMDKCLYYDIEQF